jgi:SAM-dependent methyltransferase
MFQPGQHVVVITPKSCDKDDYVEFLGKDVKITRMHHEELSYPLPMSNSAVDGVFSYSLSMTAHGPTIMEEIVRVLKPGGKIILREVVTDDEVSFMQ